MTTSFPAHVLDLAPGQPYAVSATYQGLQYPSEAVFAERWDAHWGSILQDDRFFRVVFLSSHQAVPPDELQDARIAVCVPPPGSERRQQERLRERRILREVRARYSVPGPDPAVLDQERRTYASGSVVTRTGVDVQPQVLYEAPLLTNWVAAVTNSLFSWTYPQLPIDGNRFPRPFNTEEARLLFSGLIQEDPSPEVMATVLAFGPGLGLTTADATTLDPRPSNVFQTLTDELADGQGAIPCDLIYERIVHGLPYPLLTLYLLTLLHHGQPPVELHLAHDHPLQTRTGERYPGRVILAETVADIRFVPSLKGSATLLRYMVPISWNTLVFYFSPLDPSMQPVDDPNFVEEVPKLLAALDSLRGEVHQTQNVLRRLSQALGGEVSAETQDLLNGLANLAEARAPETALRTAQRLFGSPASLAEAVEQYRPLRQLIDREAALLHLHDYLEEAPIPEELAELSLKGQQLSAVLNLRELITGAPSTAALNMLITGFMDEYRTTYIRHHQSYHQELRSLVGRLQEARIEAEALERLNTVGELGEPVEAAGPERLRLLLKALSPCQVPSKEIPLSEHPICQRCGLRLGQPSTSPEVEAVVRSVQFGLRQQNARLGIQVVHRILGGDQDERIDQFIKVVQASDLSGLANVLDDRLVAFVRSLLAQP